MRALNASIVNDSLQKQTAIHPAVLIHAYSTDSFVPSDIFPDGRCVRIEAIRGQNAVISQRV